MHQRTWLSLVTFPLVAGFTLPMFEPRIEQAPKVETKATSQDPLAGISDIQDVLNRVRDQYVDPVDMDKVLVGGIQAAVERAHPLNSYISPDELKLPDPGPADTGMRLVKRGLYAVVLSVTPGSPAAQAGILPGDGIRKLEGDSIGSLTQYTIQRRIRGAAGTTLTCLRTSLLTAESSTLTLARTLPGKPVLGIRRENGCLVVALPDLMPGRTRDLLNLLQPADSALPLLLDLRACHGGSLEEGALMAGALGLKGDFVTLQEQGKADRIITVSPGTPIRVAKIGVLVGLGTSGVAEVLASALKKGKVPSYGDRTAAFGFAATRLPLRSGGAIEVVYQRWLGVGGERLDRAVFVPEVPLRGLRADEDPVPKAIELFLKAEASTSATLRTAPHWRRELLSLPSTHEIA